MKCSEEQNSLEMEQETDSSTSPLAQAKPAQFAAELLDSRAAVTEWQRGHVGTALSYRAFGRDLSEAARRRSSLPKFLSFNLPCSVSLPWGKGILYSRTINVKQQSKAMTATKGNPKTSRFPFRPRGVSLICSNITQCVSTGGRAVTSFWSYEHPLLAAQSAATLISMWAPLAALQAMLK